MSLGFNKVCDLEDFDDPELRAVIEEIFPEAGPYARDGQSVRADSKRWEIAMSCRSLRAFDALRPEAVLLGVGAGTERTTSTSRATCVRSSPPTSTSPLVSGLTSRRA